MLIAVELAGVPRRGFSHSEGTDTLKQAPNASVHTEDQAQK
jgi:hypothetical protein